MFARCNLPSPFHMIYEKFQLLLSISLSLYIYIYIYMCVYGTINTNLDVGYLYTSMRHLAMRNAAIYYNYLNIYII